MKSFLIIRASAALNRALQDSTRAQQLCAQLEGRSLKVRASGAAWEGVLTVGGGALTLQAGSPDSAAHADVTLNGSVAALLGALGADQKSLLHKGALRIEGDAELAQRFAELLQCLRPDVEHELSRLTGPIPAHLFAGGVRALWQRGRTLLRDQSRSAADYLAYERGALVSTPEAEHRYRRIEAAREQLDRLEARLTHLETAS